VRIVSEQEFSTALRAALHGVEVGSVTGPGRSGAVAAVYASHILGVPFIPYGQPAPAGLGRVLVIDTAIESGATLRKAGRRYAQADPVVMAVYHEPPRVAFWYEAAKRQRFRHERTPVT
jgi:adenine/guanine phosphoribosyltransferase-like PRPP-binding protein